MLPPAFGNPGPRYRVALTLPPGPRRVTDDGELARFHIATGGRGPLPHGSARRPVKLGRAREILVVKLDFIGDWVLTTPFLENLRLNAPQARITVVVLDRVFDLATACPFVDRVVSIPRAEQRRVVFGAANVAELAGFRRDYREGRFDLAVVPRWDADFNGALQIAAGSRAPQIVGFSERGHPRKRILNRGDDRFYTHIVDDRRTIHEGERDLILIEAMGGEAAPTGVRVDFTAADRATAGRFLRTAVGDGGKRILAVAAFARAKTTLPAARLAPIVRRLAERFDLVPIVIGSPGNAEDAAQFVRAVGDGAVSAAGLLPPRASAALIARAAVFIGMDSGPAHIAAAVGTPVAVVSCHPAGGAPDHANAPDRFRPLGRPGEVLVIRPERARAPCTDGCEVNDAPHCILGISDAVTSAKLAAFVEAALGRRAERADGDRPAARVRVLVRRPPNGETARV